MGYIIIKNYYCDVTFWPHKASYFMTGLTAGLTKGNKKTVNRFDDQRAWFCERVNENSGGLYWLAKSILHNDEDVKDAVQEAVLTAYEKLDTRQHSLQHDTAQQAKHGHRQLGGGTARPSE